MGLKKGDGKTDGKSKAKGQGKGKRPWQRLAAACLGGVALFVLVSFGSLGLTPQAIAGSPADSPVLVKAETAIAVAGLQGQDDRMPTAPSL